MSRIPSHIGSGDGWKRVASVTKGGKPFFYFRRTAIALQWMVFDRSSRQWLGAFAYLKAY